MSLLECLHCKAEHDVAPVDSYLNRIALGIHSKEATSVGVVIWPRVSGGPSDTEVRAFIAKCPTLKARRTAAFHNLSLAINDEEPAYHIGANLKDAGKRRFGIDRALDPHQATELVARLDIRAMAGNT